MSEDDPDVTDHSIENAQMFEDMRKYMKARGIVLTTPLYVASLVLWKTLTDIPMVSDDSVDSPTGRLRELIDGEWKEDDYEKWSHDTMGMTMDLVARLFERIQGLPDPTKIDEALDG